MPVTYLFQQKTRATRKHLLPVLRLLIVVQTAGKQPLTLADALRPALTPVFGGINIKTVMLFNLVFANWSIP